MHNNPISGECAQLIVQALQYNNTLQQLYLNIGYPYDVKEKIRSLKEEVNKKRETRGCQVKLTIPSTSGNNDFHCTILCDKL